MVNVVVELVESLLHVRVPADLWADRNESAIRIHEEMPMVGWIEVHARWIGKRDTDDAEQRQRCAHQENHERRSGLHGLTPFETNSLPATKRVSLLPPSSSASGADRLTLVASESMGRQDGHGDARETR